MLFDVMELPDALVLKIGGYLELGEEALLACCCHRLRDLIPFEQLRPLCLLSCPVSYTLAYATTELDVDPRVDSSVKHAYSQWLQELTWPKCTPLPTRFPGAIRVVPWFYRRAVRLHHHGLRPHNFAFDEAELRLAQIDACVRDSRHDAHRRKIRRIMDEPVKWPDMTRFVALQHRLDAQYHAKVARENEVNEAQEEDSFPEDCDCCDSDSG